MKPKTSAATDCSLKGVLTNQNKVPDYYKVGFIHNNSCHDMKTLINLDNYTKKNGSLHRSLYTTNKDIGQVDSGLSNYRARLPREALTFSSVLKMCGLLLLVCDLFYVHISLLSVKDSLRSSSQIVDNLESQLKFTKLSYETFKADVNYLMHLNRMFTKEINSKIELLIKLNKLFVDHTDTSLNSVINIIRNQSTDDDKVVKIVNKRKTNVLKNLDSNKTVLFNKKYPSDKFKMKTVKSDDEFDAFFEGNNVSSVENFGFEKDNIDSKILLKDSKFSRKFIQSGVHRSKRHASNGSQSNNRGKHHSSKSKNRGHHRHVNCNLFCCSSGPLLVHFRGAQPEALIQDGGVIAPWFGDLAVSGDYIYRSVTLREGKAKIEITEKGLYLIYAQVYYLTSNQLNSFSINIQREKELSQRVIALCSTEASIQGMSEVSCFTSIVYQLEPGDMIFLIQRERHRRIIFREGHTFLGLVALNNPPKC